MKSDVDGEGGGKGAGEDDGKGSVEMGQRRLLPVLLQSAACLGGLAMILVTQLAHLGKTLFNRPGVAGAVL